ncbi:MAG: hypothetical protein AB7O26_15250 [Planctomycetaceae bacterium]
MTLERKMTEAEIEKRAALVRKSWSAEERLSRLELPPDSVLWDEYGLARPHHRNGQSQRANHHALRRSRPERRETHRPHGF